MVVLLLGCCSLTFAQDDLKFGDTEKTNVKPTYKSSTRDFKPRKTLVLIQQNTSKLLTGNACWEEFQQEKGVKMAFLNKNEPGNYSAISRWFHNTGVRIRGTFRYGPFWVIRFNKKKNECREILHDFIG